MSEAAASVVALDDVVLELRGITGSSVPCPRSPGSSLQLAVGDRRTTSATTVRASPP